MVDDCMSRARTNALSTRLLGLAAITLLAAPAVRAQVSVEFKVAAREVYANEAVLASLEVHNFQTCEEPAFPDIEGCTVQQRGEGLNSRFTQIVGGRITETRKRVYEYELTPTRVGTLLIPAIPVNVDGQTMKTRPVRLTVRPSNAAELFFAEITIDKRRVYIGEEVPATMTLWIKPARYGRRWRGANDMLNRVWAPNLGPFPKQIANANDVRRRRTVNGVDETFYAFDFVAEIPILQVGTLRFDDSALGIAYPAEG